MLSAGVRGGVLIVALGVASIAGAQDTDDTGLVDLETPDAYERVTEEQSGGTMNNNRYDSGCEATRTESGTPLGRDFCRLKAEVLGVVDTDDTDPKTQNGEGGIADYVEDLVADVHALNQEAGKAIAAEEAARNTAINFAIGEEVIRVDAEIEAVETAIDEEETARIAAIADEQAAREDLQQGLLNTISNHLSARVARDDELEEDIEEEETARIAAIADEQAARMTADVALQANIDAQEAMVTEITTTVETTTEITAEIETKIETLETERVAADTALREDLAEVEQELSGGIAMAMALQAPAVPPGKRLNLSLGAGAYNGEIAYGAAFGVKLNERATMNGGFGYAPAGGGKVGGKIGVSFAW